MKVVLIESLGISKELLDSYAEALRAQGHEFAAYERDLDVEVQKERLKDADVLMIANMPLKAEVLDACPNLKFIDVAFTGVDHIPVARAKELGIAVSNASGYSNESVAELVLGMTLTLARKVPLADKLTRTGGVIGKNVGFELQGKTVGIIGTGAIGSRVAELFNAFGCRVLGYYVHPRNLPNVEYMSMEDLLAQSDIVTLHTPLIDSTRGLINAKTIALMKDGAILINASRGPVVDAAALAEALKSGKLAAAGVDVYDVEPPIPAENPLLAAPNTILTPHIAFLSVESMVKRAAIVFHSLDEWFKGNQINKIV